MAEMRAFRLIPLSARAKLTTSRWVGVRSSRFLQKERMVRLLRLRPERAEKKVGAGIRVGDAHLESEPGVWGGWSLSNLPAIPLHTWQVPQCSSSNT